LVSASVIEAPLHLHFFVPYYHYGEEARLTSRSSRLNSFLRCIKFHNDLIHVNFVISSKALVAQHGSKPECSHCYNIARGFSRHNASMTQNPFDLALLMGAGCLFYIEIVVYL
jgi:hypothetical protein